ncbi:intermembrane transport protein PqiB [Sphingomonas bacterium]|uniref:PqiB family protein n=1 Tax=Sphingomonas bacterium TaxID=1895847 RepID=UPI0015751364|nr:MlaD family protein [Sphingomonas bacterium]
MSDERSTPSPSGGDADHGRHWPTARRMRRRWPGLVWAVPLAALLVVGYLGVRWLTTRGTEVTVTFLDAEGVTPGDTKVLENGVEVGHVTRIAPTGDGHVTLTLSMTRQAEPALNTASRFWLIGEQPSITDLQSVRAAIAGLIVGLAPGKGGTPTHHFTGLDRAPLVMPGAKGRYFYLDTNMLGSVQPGAAVLYQGQNIGSVTNTGFRALDQFRVQVFVNAPFDRLVRSGALFWRGSPFKVSLSGSGLQTQIASPSSVFSGSVQFDLPEGARGGAPLPQGSAFPLYDGDADAHQGPSGPEQDYDLVLQGAAGDLTNGAPVSLLGYKVGEVRSARLVFAPGSRRPYTAATIALFPLKLDVRQDDAAAPAVWRASTDAAVRALLAQGYRATLTQTIPLVGGHAIALARGAGSRPATLLAGADHPVIPVAIASGDVGDLIDQAQGVLAKVNRMPLEQIGANVRGLTANLSRITGSPQVSDSLTHLDATLKQLDGITRQVQPQIGPLMTRLNETASELQQTAAAAKGTLGGGGANQDESLPEAVRQLTEAARSIRSLTDYLDRHPESLLRGKAKEK